MVARVTLVWQGGVGSPLNWDIPGIPVNETTAPNTMILPSFQTVSIHSVRCQLFPYNRHPHSRMIQPGSQPTFPLGPQRRNPKSMTIYTNAFTGSRCHPVSFRSYNPRCSDVFISALFDTFLTHFQCHVMCPHRAEFEKVTEFMNKKDERYLYCGTMTVDGGNLVVA